MSELIRSIEKSVAFLKERYPPDLPLLIALEEKLQHLYARQGRAPRTDTGEDRQD